MEEPHEESGSAPAISEPPSSREEGEIEDVVERETKKLSQPRQSLPVTAPPSPPASVGALATPEPQFSSFHVDFKTPPHATSPSISCFSLRETNTRRDHRHQVSRRIPQPSNHLGRIGAPPVSLARPHPHQEDRVALRRQETSFESHSRKAGPLQPHQNVRWSRTRWEENRRALRRTLSSYSAKNTSSPGSSSSATTLLSTLTRS